MLYKADTFQFEIWSRIMLSCSTGTLKNLSLTSSRYLTEARRYMYHTLLFGHGPLGIEPNTDPYLATYVADSEVFNKVHQGNEHLHEPLRNSVRRIYLQWPPHMRVGIREMLRANGGGAPGPDGIRELIQTMHGHELEYFVTLQNLLVKENPKFEVFHLTLPIGGENIPSSIHRHLTSIMFPLSDGDPEEQWPDLLKVFQLPNLRYLELSNWVQTNYGFPDSLRRTG